MRALTGDQLDGVSFAFGTHTCLNQIDLHIDAGSIVALLGAVWLRQKYPVAPCWRELNVPAAGEMPASAIR